MTSKRQVLIDTAFQLFYQKGVHAVGINEILTESGVAKKTLYSHFPSKDALLLATLEYRDEIFCTWFEAQLDNSKTKTLAESGLTNLDSLIDALFNALDKWFNDNTEVLSPFHGCFFINVSAEYGDHSSAIHQHCARHKERIKKIISKAVMSISDDAEKIQSLTQALCLLKEGAIVQAYVQGDKKAAMKARETAELLLV